MLECLLASSGSVFGSPGDMVRGERKLLNMSSNNYIGFTHQPDILEVMREGGSLRIEAKFSE
ncbi:hypothetical protein GC093_13600 [Paenibacillus sp. LMG 31456]|uniref:8-amino-7-oxononanoate synthase n=1 Tax=Paenibacillus foliorum TaxID=2654974 RepID=A0A972GWR4_9BACL|nr:hypothetical protein [Paenibacillus foliorum]NOU94245.1 hypothetical protein [Paenibacillus foliorum]